MAFDSLTLGVLISELNKTIIGAKITKINQPERDEVILTVYNKANYKLVLSANATINRLLLTEYAVENPQTPPNFCMLLRKHVLNGVIEKITQMPYERLADFKIIAKNELGYNEEKHLIFELTGKTANLILTDSNYTILETLKHLPQDLDSARIMLSGAKYTSLPARNKLTIEQIDEITRLIANSTDNIGDLLKQNLLGVANNTVDEMLFGIDKENHSLINCSRVIDGINNYTYKLKNLQPNIIFVNGIPSEVYPFDYLSAKGKKTVYPTLNKAHDEFYYLKDRALRFSQKSKAISTTVKNTVARYEKKIAIQLQAIIDAENNQTNKIYGDLILANLFQLKKNDEQLVTTNYYEESCPTVTIPLDKSKTPQQNAQEYYKKYRKQKNTVEITTKLVEENKEMLDYLKSVQLALTLCESNADLLEINEELIANGVMKANKNEKIKPVQAKPIEYEIEGYKVFVGKNNAQNDFVTFKIAVGSDTWLHTQSIHSSHVVIVGKGEEIPDKVLLTAAEITAYYSQSKLGGKIAVDYTLKKNLKKPPKAKMGFVIYNTYNTLIVEANRHAEYLVN